jgi:hypothetical protein
MITEHIALWNHCWVQAVIHMDISRTNASAAILLWIKFLTPSFLSELKYHPFCLSYVRSCTQDRRWLRSHLPSCLLSLSHRIFWNYQQTFHIPRGNESCVAVTWGPMPTSCTIVSKNFVPTSVSVVSILEFSARRLHRTVNRNCRCVSRGFFRWYYALIHKSTGNNDLSINIYSCIYMYNVRSMVCINMFSARRA